MFCIWVILWHTFHFWKNEYKEKPKVYLSISIKSSTTYILINYYTTMQYYYCILQESISMAKIYMYWNYLFLVAPFTFGPKVILVALLWCIHFLWRQTYRHIFQCSNVWHWQLKKGSRIQQCCIVYYISIA